MVEINEDEYGVFISLSGIPSDVEYHDGMVQIWRDKDGKIVAISITYVDDKRRRRRVYLHFSDTFDIFNVIVNFLKANADLNTVRISAGIYRSKPIMIRYTKKQESDIMVLDQWLLTTADGWDFDSDNGNTVNEYAFYKGVIPFKGEEYGWYKVVQIDFNYRIITLFDEYIVER
ncbi:hypothetical protein SBFV3_gp48 [Sulfolobales Beppu filamentous virus 3]|uniref:Uncharacterized protein n=1 Tax=Sulfolobales Beppu filamentous virus 3 TaxID=2493124 RepID=A0A3S8NF57_9VIRU|nr:hypothetical protein HOU83_gp48 [Sulfolobales Beppu filamentous virus 3]AZI75883.1 hypothetical protein SBFV3_gp48 [Sulfolobales Beppu filamentous virus 3]